MTRKALATVVVASTMFAVAACAEEAVEPDAHEQSHFGYALNTSLATTNAGSLLGVATEAAQLSARLYPAVYVQGPSGR